MLGLVLRATAGRRARRCGDADAAEAEATLERAFGCSARLAVYGTLAPGECNHHRLDGCAGTWTRGTVRGRRTVRQFPAFTYDAGAPPVPVHVLASAALASTWSALDAFEGDDYRRILVPVFAGAALVTVANLYEACTPVAP